MKDDDDSYDAILNRTWDEIPEEKVLPDGWYILKARNASFVRPKGAGNAKVLVYYTVDQPLEDVNADEIAALGQDYDMSENQIVKTFWVGNNRDWRDVMKHLQLLGVETEGRSTLDTLKDVKGNPVAARLVYRTFQTSGGQNVETNDPVEFAPIS